MGRSLKQHQLERQVMPELYQHYLWCTALLVFSGWLGGVSIHEYCVPTGSSALYAHVNSHVGFRKRHRPLERRAFGGHFLPQNLHGKAEGIMSPGMQKHGTREFGGSGRHAGQGVKASVSRTSGRLDRDRDAWSRLQAGGSTVKFETALSQGRQICLQAGSLFYAMPGPYSGVQAALCFARACLSPALWELLSKHIGHGRTLKVLFCLKELMYTKYRGFFSTSSTVHLSYRNSTRLFFKMQAMVINYFSFIRF